MEVELPYDVVEKGIAYLYDGVAFYGNLVGALFGGVLTADG